MQSAVLFFACLVSFLIARSSNSIGLFEFERVNRSSKML